MKFRIREKKSRVEKFKDRADRAKALYFSLVVSLASIIMSCFCLLGTTYALFTSTANTDNNSLGTGFLSVSLHNVDTEQKVVGNEFIQDLPIVGSQEVSPGYEKKQLVYVRNNSTILAEYNLTFKDSNADKVDEETNEVISSIADIIDVSYCVIDDVKTMNRSNYIYLGKLSDIMKGDKKISGDLSIIKPESEESNNDEIPLYPFGKLYEICFSVSNSVTDSLPALANLDINICLEATQYVGDIHQVSVNTELYNSNGDDLEYDTDGNKLFIPCTNFTGCGDYYAGNREEPIKITIPTSYVIGEGEDLTEYIPFAYSINDGSNLPIDNLPTTDQLELESILSLDGDIDILVKYKVKVREQK